MARDTLETAAGFMRFRKFDKAIKLLESRASIYEDNFDYYLMLGTACLYAGDTGSASSYYQRARSIKITDKNLLLGQAALYLRRGDTDRAINYYVDILDNDPGDKRALSAMEFIRMRGDFNTICRWVDTGKIEQFYPPVGANPYKAAGIIVPVIACALGCALVLFLSGIHSPADGKRADLSSLVLTVNEQKNAQETDLSSGAFAYILSVQQISGSYEKAQRYFQSYRDNLAQIEINRILNSNASVAIKQKARLLMEYLEPPTFDTLSDNISYSQVAKEPALYLDCWVAWSGRISNAVQSEKSYSCDLLVGYEFGEKVDGIVPVVFTVPPVISADKAVTVLGKISTENGRLCLRGKAVYQSVKENN